jgi:hypothetical protein
MKQNSIKFVIKQFGIKKGGGGDLFNLGKK